MENVSLQAEEIEALSSIYEGELRVIDEASRTYMVSISEDPKLKINLKFTLPESYPSKSAPKYELHAPWVHSSDKVNLNKKLEQIYEANPGENVLFAWVECIREFMQGQLDTLNSQKQSDREENKNKIDVPEVSPPPISHGEPLTDRRSTFQAHLAHVTDTQQVKAVKEALLQNRKIANAAHNIMAYRIFNPGNSNYYQDCDDDGETAAGGRMLHLLQILDVKDVVVIVSRWYGGILLGPDRFKHINNVTRSILVQEGYVDEGGGKKTKKTTKS